MNTKNKHIGSDFDDFLKDEGLLEQAETAGIKRVIVHQIEAATKHLNLTKAAMAKRMHTSRSELDRLLDPENDSVTLTTLNRAASALGKKLKVQLV